MAVSDTDAPLRRFVIIREMPGVGSMTADELSSAAKNSCDVLRALGSDKVQWSHSYVCQDSLHCVYLAQDAAIIKEHAAKAGVPADRVEEVMSVLDPTSAAGAQ